MQPNRAQSSIDSRRHLTNRLISLTCGLAALVLGASAQAFYTPGQFGVSATGAANYTIPIAIPPGTAGMVPSLAINYNSQGGNGLLGVGWSLSGLSAITRCPKTKVQDGITMVREAPQYATPSTSDTSDKYCLDGQRLVLFSGTYGTDGAEYRTERDSFSRIISYGVSGVPTSGPRYFKVWTKAGLIMEYGNSADSLIALQGKNHVQVWALNKVSDTKGNYYKVSYQDNGYASGEFYPTRIDYTGNAKVGLAPYNSVRFVYETRPDSPVMYDNTGSRIQVTKRLTNIQTYAREGNVDTPVKDYLLTYEVNPSPATKRSRIVKITERDGSLNPLPATTVTWDATGDAIGSATSATVSSSLWRVGVNGWDHRYTGDFNGDGKTDLLAQWTDSATSGMLCTGLATSMSCSAITLPPGSGAGVVADFNGDGYDDFLSIGGSSPLCLGPGLTTCNATGVVLATRGPYVGNVNGDEYPDLIFYNATRWGNADPGAYYSFSRGYCLGPDLNVCVQSPTGQGREIVETQFVTRPPSVADVALGDFNADGKTDLIYALENGGTYLCSGEAIGRGDAACTLMNSGGWGIYYRLHSSDFNGDGISDLYLIGDGSSYFCPGPGVATTGGNNCQAVSGSAGWKSTFSVLPGDYNGDGVSDLYLVGTANSYFCAGPGIATGNNCAPKVVGDWKSPYDIRPGDYDGDGTTDLFLISDTARYFVETGAGKADRVASITNGLGVVTSITYKPLTDVGVYAKGTGTYVMGAGYLELQAPMYVVSSVSSSNGVGGTVGSSYYYWRARAHLAGGGFMGFEVVRSCDTNVIPNICTQTWYTQDYPHQGLATKVLKFTKNGATFPYLNLVANTWDYRSWTYSDNSLLGTTYHVPMLAKTQEVSYELAKDGTSQGAAITNVTTTNTYDDYGNPLVISVSSLDTSVVPNLFYKKVTTNLYDNDTTGLNLDGSLRWLLGRLREAKVSSVVP